MMAVRSGGTSLSWVMQNADNNRNAATERRNDESGQGGETYDIELGNGASTEDGERGEDETRRDDSTIASGT